MKKRTINLLTFLMMLSLCSIGFSSWIIAPSNDEFTVDENIVVDPTVDASKYIVLDTLSSVNNTGIDYFSYSNKGFVNSATQELPATEGYIKVYYIIKMDKFKALYENETSLQFKVSLGYAKNMNNPDNFNIFVTDTEGNRSFDCSISCDENITSSELVKPTQEEIESKYEYVTYINFNNILSSYNESVTEYRFSLTYTMNVKSTSYFESNIYPQINKIGSSFGFALKTSFVSFMGTEVSA